MKILITGNAGLLGSRLADWILANIPDCQVIGIDDLSGGFSDNVDKRVQFYEMNLLDHEKLAEVFATNQPDIVFHFAAYAAEGLSPFVRRFNYKNNLISTVNIVNNCINFDVKRLVFSSSMAVYGNASPPFGEDIPLQPIDPYGIAKAACERDIQVAGEMHGLDWCIVRPHNVYGRNQNIWDKYRNVIGIWMYQHLNGDPLSIFGDGNQCRAFSYIDDCTECLWKAGTDIRAKGQIINLGGTKSYKINDVSDILIKIIGSGSKRYFEKRHEVKMAWSTYEKSIRLLDYKDCTTIEKGISEMWEWAKRKPKRLRKKWEAYEVEKGLYSFWR